MCLCMFINSHIYTYSCVYVQRKNVTMAVHVFSQSILNVMTDGLKTVLGQSITHFKTFNNTL